MQAIAVALIVIGLVLIAISFFARGRSRTALVTAPGPGEADWLNGLDGAQLTQVVGELVEKAGFRVNGLEVMTDTGADLLAEQPGDALLGEKIYVRVVRRPGDVVHAYEVDAAKQVARDGGFDKLFLFTSGGFSEEALRLGDDALLVDGFALSRMVKESAPMLRVPQSLTRPAAARIESPLEQPGH